MNCPGRTWTNFYKPENNCLTKNRTIWQTIRRERETVIDDDIAIIEEVMDYVHIKTEPEISIDSETSDQYYPSFNQSDYAEYGLRYVDETEDSIQCNTDWLNSERKGIDDDDDDDDDDDEYWQIENNLLYKNNQYDYNDELNRENNNCKYPFQDQQIYYEPQRKSYGTFNGSASVYIRPVSNETPNTSIDSDAWKYYTNSHQQVKSYICDVCDKLFHDRDCLRNHLFSHFKIKKFQCKLCRQKFVRRDNLKLHITAKHQQDKFICPICAKPLTYLSSYRRHVLLHKEERPYKCEICRKSYVALGVLNAHIRQKH